MKHLKKAGVDSPQLSRKNLKPVDAIKMLRKAGYFKSMQATAAESDAPTSPVKPSFMDMTMVRLPIFLVFSLPLNLYNIFSKATATRKLKADEDLASGVDYSDRDSGRSTPKKKRKHVPRSSSNLHIAAHQQGGVEMNRTASSASSNSSTMSEINSKTNDPFGAEFSAKLSKMVAADSSAEQEGGPQLKSGEWTVDEVVLLAQLMKKYPAAVPGRWVKIGKQFRILEIFVVNLLIQFLKQRRH